MMEYYNVLLTSEDAIKDTTNVSDNIAGKYLLPAIKATQDIEVQEILGTRLYRSLQEKIYNDSISHVENEIYKALLDNYVEQFIAWQVMANICPLIGAKIANMGVMSNGDVNATNVSESERNSVRDYYQKIADYYKHEMQMFCQREHNRLPELTDNNCNETHANLDSAATTSIWLGGSRGKRTWTKIRTADEHGWK